MGGGAARELYIVDIVDGARTRLTNNDGNDQAADWSPNGGRIVFFSQQDGNPEIYLVASDGSQSIRVTRDEEWDFMPRWSPDGSRIAFDSRRDGRCGIWVMDADGSGQTEAGAVLRELIEQGGG